MFSYRVKNESAIDGMLVSRGFVAYQRSTTNVHDHFRHGRAALTSTWSEAYQYAKVVGHIEREPIEHDPETGNDVGFENGVMGGTLFLQLKGFVLWIPKRLFSCRDFMKHQSFRRPHLWLPFGSQEGAFHAVDSSELGFRITTNGAFREAYIMAPAEFQSQAIGSLNTRRGTIIGSEVHPRQARNLPNATFALSLVIFAGEGEFKPPSVLPKPQKRLEEARLYFSLKVDKNTIE
ncbi:hypothetical protein M378DRAFT_28399 [Amanita muscaria Koide BX008]|uniref:Uncharacterized protein n=1 Tax=Amanita muscaria (strain Koide BX008) TaxID=946122 RepID=A0A0C2WJ35_AMAMK|nr:hypothetical protein M378DRAFT_28399 [Amanita muscaria Koide BX008]